MRQGAKDWRLPSPLMTVPPLLVVEKSKLREIIRKDDTAVLQRSPEAAGSAWRCRSK